MLKCCDVVEPYHPEQVLRQFGQVQMISPIISAHTITASHANSYNYYLGGMWDNQENHMLAGVNRSVPMRRPSNIVPGYLEWYLNMGYPFVQNLNYGVAFDPFASMQTLNSNSLQERDERILSFIKSVMVEQWRSILPFVGIGD
ncbi:unnamed protein product [Prunus armeniaca]|uniref:Aminotransferase-like plant mobile domain-containing protein n=1 Tax=Prunus armeniaca TaxID=36596 RepID=A0A6J5XZA7_PRUAR|nr:unnamed protein product [Prunus armeniaca]